MLYYLMSRLLQPFMKQPAMVPVRVRAERRDHHDQ